MQMKIVISLLFLVFSSISKAQVEKYQCIKSAKKYEKIFKLPENLLVSIALTESGKKIKNPVIANRKYKYFWIR